MGERLNGIQEVRGSIPLASIVGRLIVDWPSGVDPSGDWRENDA